MLDSMAKWLIGALLVVCIALWIYGVTHMAFQPVIEAWTVECNDGHRDIVARTKGQPGASNLETWECADHSGIKREIH